MTSTVEQLTVELDALRSASTRQSIEAEEALHDLASELSTLKSQLEDERTAHLTIQEQEKALQTRISELEASVEREKNEKKRDVSGEAERKVREEELEKEKRELLSAYERSEADKIVLEDSLSALRTLHNSLQTSHSTLEASLQEVTATSRTSLLSLQTLTSTVSSLEADKTFLAAELERGRSEWATYRREKHAELVRIQAESENHELEERNAKLALDKLKSSYDGLVERHATMAQSLASTREELGVSESNFTMEIGSMKRLVKMMERREGERKARIEEVERGLEEERAAKAANEAEILEQLRVERERSDILDLRCVELNEALRRGASSFSGLLPEEGDMNSPSPRGSFSLSPSGQMAVRGQKSGRSYAEVYGEYMRMQEELAKERSETARLGDCLAQILGDIEERAPLLKEQRLEYDRLSSEYASLASQLSDALVDRDDFSRREETNRLDIDRLERDNAVLTNQLRDLGRQVRVLARSIAAAEIAGIEGRSTDGDHDEEEEAIRQRAESSSDTDAVVSAHLVTFRTINELQIQNQKLLRITRQMGAQLERAEDDAEGKRRGLENSAVEEAHELILKLKDEVESQRAKSDAFIRERDMFRRMLAQRGSDGPVPTNGTNGDGMEVDTDAARMLVEVQTSFEQCKVEIAVHSERLRDDLAEAQREANGARTELAKQRAQAEFATERFRLLKENFGQQALELDQATKRTLKLQQSMGRQDQAVHTASEELLTLKGQSDQLQHENTNLRSEREIWKSVESRLINENNALNKERSHLADLMSNLQILQNELERSSSDSRRRLEEQVTRLEAQCAELRDKLNQETDASRQLALRKEFDTKAFQERLDKLSAEHQTARESLLVAQSKKEHLEERVSDLLLQTTAKEEKLAIYEGRNASAGGDASQTREQQLEVVVADLRAELRSTKADLERAATNLEQFQAIAETQGESLCELNATYDEYKLSMDTALADKEAENTSIRERLHSLTTELTAGQTQNSELHGQIEEERRNFEKERKVLEDSMADLRAADASAQSARLAAKSDMHRQARLAKEAHERYQRELLDHAEDVKRLSSVTQKLEGLRTTLRESQTAEEVAKANLLASEASWTLQKEALEQEISDYKKRCDDLTTQNAVLHDHLQNFGSQAARLEQNPPSADEEAATGDKVGSDDQLREVIRYLRREKDIGDLQLEFNKQELARLRQQLEFATRTLEEARSALTESRSKIGEVEATSAQHAELLERIHTAKLLRESNQTLRDENESNARKVTQLQRQLNNALAELEPLKEKALTLQAEVESKEHNVRLLQEDNERWKTRNQTILAKYERIDPEELSILKNAAAEANAHLERAQEQIAALTAEVAGKAHLAESMRSNWNSTQDRFKSLQAVARITRDEKTALAAEVAELMTKIEKAASENDGNLSIEEVTKLKAQITSLEGEKKDLESKLEQQVSRLSDLEQQVGKLSEEKSLSEQSKSVVDKELATQQTRNQNLLRDNRTFIAKAKEHAASIEKMKVDFVENNAAAIKEAVDAQVTVRDSSAVAPSAAEIEEIVKQRISDMESTLATQHKTAVAAAITAATAPLEAQLATLRAEASNTAPTPAEGSETLIKEMEQKLETEKAQLVARFEQEKAGLVKQAKVHADEISTQLTAEITRLKSLPPATSTVLPPDVDAIVQAKVAALLKERSEEQRKAIEAAVAEITAKKDAEYQATLIQAREQMDRESAMKNRLLQAKVLKLEATAKIAKAAAAASPTSSPATTTPHATIPASGGTPTPLPALVATTPPSGIPTGVAIRGTRGGRGGPPGLSLRGAARGGGAPRGGVLAALGAASAGNPPKRVRPAEESEEGGDLSKRLKKP